MWVSPSRRASKAGHLSYEFSTKLGIAAAAGSSLGRRRAAALECRAAGRLPRVSLEKDWTDWSRPGHRDAAEAAADCRWRQTPAILNTPIPDLLL